jgi:hypothetical protein
MTTKRQEDTDMAARQTKQAQRERELDHEIATYREAATAALDQLEWAIEYLNQIRKSQIAAVLARNRNHIIKTMR